MNLFQYQLQVQQKEFWYLKTKLIIISLSIFSYIFIQRNIIKAKILSFKPLLFLIIF